MKTSYKLFLLLFLFNFVACDDDDVKPDTIAPTITITTPAAHATLFALENKFELKASIKDNINIRKVRVFMLFPDGTRRMTSSEKFEFSDNYSYHLLKLDLIYPSGDYVTGIPALGAYSIIVEAEDAQQNVRESAVHYILQAPDLTLAEFNTSFARNNAFKGLDIDKDTFLSGEELGAMLFDVYQDSDYEYFIKEYWVWIVEDMGLKGQKWVEWDMNSNGFVELAEFIKGFSSSGFLAEWDRDKDNRLSEEEFSSYLFARWDINSDNVLLPDEYLVNFYRKRWL